MSKEAKTNINPYGVGALGAGAIAAFGYSPLFEKVVTKRLDDKLAKTRSAWSKTYESWNGHRESVRKIEDKISDALRIKLNVIKDMYKAPEKNMPAFKAYIDVIDKDIADLESYRDLYNYKQVDRLSARLKRLDNVRSKLLNKYIKRVTPLAIGTKLVAPVAMLGLGGKYLYDKLKD